jgi:predicted MFS family arabinose efflux permease
MSIEVADADRSPHDIAVWPTVGAGLLALAVAMGIGRFAFTPILPAMRDAFGLSPAALAGLASANYLGYLLGALAAATPLLTRRSGPILRGSLLLVIAATALMAASSTMPVWLALRFLAGVASAGVFVYGSTLVLGWLARRGRLDLSGWFYSGVGVGIAGSGLAVLASQRVRQGEMTAWRIEWLAVALLAAALAAMCWPWLPRSLEPDVSRPAPEREAAPAPPPPSRFPLPMVLLGAAYFLDGAGYIVAGTFLVAIVAAVPALADLGPGVWMLAGIAGAPSAILWTRAGARLGPLAALTLAYALQAAGLALPVLSGSSLAAALSAALFGGTFIGITSLTIAETRRRVPPLLAARAIALFTAVFGLGQVLGPLLAAWLAGAEGDFRRALGAASIAVLAGAALTAAAGVLPERRMARSSRRPA